MNKRELILAVAQSAELTHKQAAKAVDAMVGAIEGALAKGQTVALVGFGTFSLTRRAARTARNPRTGEAVMVPASKTLHFKPSKKFKDAVQ